MVQVVVGVEIKMIKNNYRGWKLRKDQVQHDSCLSCGYDDTGTHRVLDYFINLPR